MNPEEMRIAIARDLNAFCGWYCNRCREHKNPYDGETICPDCERDLVPDSLDYLNDLNAIHEVINKLSDEEGRFGQESELTRYCMTLLRIKVTVMEDGQQFETNLFDLYGWLALIKATALQCAEAYCRMKWPEKFNN